MVDALLLDFYGTVVHEDEVLIDRICQIISRSAPMRPDPSEIGAYWWANFSRACRGSHGEGFQTQRRIETESLTQTIRNFGATCDAKELAATLFDHWQRPPVFDDAPEFFAAVDLPTVVVSNIDRCDIEAAIAHNNLAFERVITSEDVRSYKPRPELFQAGLEAVGCSPGRVLHIGDSLTSDVAGALALGIQVAWVNRLGRPSPDSVRPTHEVRSLADLAERLGAPGT